ncbi:MAG: hypothetical protein AAF502_02040 [Bacteroidota bacterium]
MKRVVLITFALLIAGTSFAQSYKTAIGARLGQQTGLTIDQHLFKNIYIEGIFITNFKTKSTVVVLGKFQKKILFRGFHYYFGGGLHKAWDASLHTAERDLKNPVGVTGVAGVGINLGKVNLALDYKPAVNIVGGDRLLQSQAAVSVRYILGRTERNGPFRRNRK